MFIFDFVAHFRQCQSEMEVAMQRLLQQRLNAIFDAATIQSCTLTGHTIMAMVHCTDRDPRFTSMPLEMIAEIVRADLQPICEQVFGAMLIDLALVTYALSQEQRRII